jgi:hypothetical protein
VGKVKVEKHRRKGAYDITEYQATHICGGAITGSDPKTSALKRYPQGWDVPNVTGDNCNGIGRWSVEDVAEYLEAGMNRFQTAAG